LTMRKVYDEVHLCRTFQNIIGHINISHFRIERLFVRLHEN